MLTDKPYAALSLDLDNLWSYLRNAGAPNWEAFPSFLDRCVPRIIDFFAHRPENLTVFIVGVDAAQDINRHAFELFGQSRFDLGNHSYHHDAVKSYATAEDARAELSRADIAIHDATHRKSSGYRGPGYAHSAQLIDAAKSLGYSYDSSILPSSVTPIVSRILLLRSSLTPQQRKDRRAFIGNASDVFFPLRPFIWNTNSGPLYEVPITTAPFARLPFHMSYLLALLKRSESLAFAYFRMSLNLCRWTGVEPCFTLHALDFLGDEDVPELRGKRSSGLSARQKVGFIARCLDELSAHYEVQSLSRYCEVLAGRPALRARRPTP